LQGSGSLDSSLKFLDFEIFGFRELGSAIGDDRIRGFVDSFSRFSGISFWRVGAGLAVQNARFRSFEFKGPELGIEDCGFGVRID
jgi:hypothetical protein